MISLKKIQEPVINDIQQFELFFKEHLKSPVPFLEIITNYLFRRKGKQIRPLFVLLSARMHGNINKSTHVAATLIELLHTATLVHDDVVDESFERRGGFSVNALWNSKIAVLLGDFFLARGLLVSVQHKEMELLEIVSKAVEEMSEGEIYQIQKTRKLNITEEEYLTIIRKKTACLFAASTAAGTKSVTDNKETIEVMRQAGEDAGMAFQIKDDILDFEKDPATGKHAGNDVKEKKITLPLIYSLQQAEKNERAEILRIINKSEHLQSDLPRILEFIHKHKGIDYAVERMNTYRDNALSLIRQFPQNEASLSLESLLEYISTRDR